MEVGGEALGVMLGGMTQLRALALDAHFVGAGSGVLGRLRGLTRLEVREGGVVKWGCVGCGAG